MHAANNSLLAEVESAISSGSADKRADALRRITDLFMVRADNYSDEQVEVFDGVISRLADKIESQARAELAKRLAPVARAPVAVIRSLARDQSIAVAAPVLTHSPRLTEEELLAIASGEGQDRLLAISKRVNVSEAVSDVLVTRGNREVLRSVVGNDSARFSHAGFGRLVERSVGDDELSVSVGLRKDIPKEHFKTLVSKASEAVFEKISAANPAAANEINSILFELTGHKVGSEPPVSAGQRDFTQAKANFEGWQRSGKPLESTLQQLAGAGRYGEIVVAVATLCQLPVETVDHVFSDKSGNTDLALLLIKAAELRWPTAKPILDLLRGEQLTPAAADTARVHFERLQTGTAKRVVRFYQVRRASGEV